VKKRPVEHGKETYCVEKRPIVHGKETDTAEAGPTPPLINVFPTPPQTDTAEAGQVDMGKPMERGIVGLF
jgi:hypothetical protein